MTPSTTAGYALAPDTNPGSDDSDLPDVVATRGAHLEPRPPTPTCSRVDGGNFHAILYAKLSAVASQQEWRYSAYGNEVAEKWRMGHTPTVTKWAARHAAETQVKKMMAPSGTPSPSSSPDVNPYLEKLLLQEQARDRVRSRQPPRASEMPSPSDAEQEDTAAASNPHLTEARGMETPPSGESVNSSPDNRVIRTQQRANTMDSLDGPEVPASESRASMNKRLREEQLRLASSVSETILGGSFLP
ncbi:hypothetical protein C8A01DRAFT_35370 [Parachaetomium inaequale]|uniref:Uncharacterized protein n=1 Tax=Parachaetomium inaequale TaxID=2588326 RepID=A0AAN6PH19_9PEZI|nr:hypothetical protein C8A01DRAFT_35370 [Parachaetomium inaequale]